MHSISPEDPPLSETVPSPHIGIDGRLPKIHKTSPGVSSHMHSRRARDHRARNGQGPLSPKTSI
jgi:hypothetical protein